MGKYDTKIHDDDCNNSGQVVFVKSTLYTKDLVLNMLTIYLLIQIIIIMNSKVQVFVHWILIIHLNVC